ncbi:MAG: aminotransferase class IV, partial [Candidatus Aminicenantes bacterium]|nr:aminotransferase class IV [Candidatus Aminicenantes bacterium]
EQGVCVYLLPWRRIHHSQIRMTAKLGGVYVQSTICGLEARDQGCDEAVFLNLEGRIAEGPGENLFIVSDGVVRTNDKTESVLEGITRTTILEIARDLGFKTEVGPIRKEEFCEADEAFFTGTAVEVIPIVRYRDGSDPEQTIKDASIGSGKPGPVSLQLTKAYKDIVGGRNPKYESWLTYIRD